MFVVFKWMAKMDEFPNNKCKRKFDWLLLKEKEEEEVKQDFAF